NNASTSAPGALPRVANAPGALPRTTTAAPVAPVTPPAASAAEAPVRSEPVADPSEPVVVASVPLPRPAPQPKHGETPAAHQPTTMAGLFGKLFAGRRRKLSRRHLTTPAPISPPSQNRLRRYGPFWLQWFRRRPCALLLPALPARFTRRQRRRIQNRARSH